MKEKQPPLFSVKISKCGATQIKKVPDCENCEFVAYAAERGYVPKADRNRKPRKDEWKCPNCGCLETDEVCTHCGETIKAEVIKVGRGRRTRRGGVK